MKLSLISLIVFLFTAEVALAQAVGETARASSAGAATAGSLIIIADGHEQIRIRPQAESTNMLAPVAAEERDKQPMCISVCSSWGQECKQGGSYADVPLRKCRRTCTSASEECL